MKREVTYNCAILPLLNVILSKNIDHSKDKHHEQESCSIGLPHHVSKTRSQMPMSDRATQFAPFAALTGYDDAVKETGRLTDDKIELEESSLNVLNAKIRLLWEKLADAPEVTFTYFKPDDRKDGGAYLTITGTVKKIDDYERLIVLQDGMKLPMDDILDINGDIFGMIE